ncbi:hypothetical protein PM023_13175 [Halorubrum ezzemoulense]|uniref:hypothetical protein n=1 Tax=Halorubrum ezzemoulense TaxID=337243 RepID=UPI00232AECF0|nr:hypothetical protein [Halorubrum ezzemoulense]MDB2225622.1 hypothetical protein [Halorubrum ezzemoulense]
MDERYDRFERVYHVYAVERGEIASVSTGDEYGVLTAGGELIEMDDHRPARVYAACRALYGEIPLVDDRDVVPIQIAVTGKPAIATYHYMAHYEYYNNLGPRYNEGKREIAEQMDISYKTVQKYFRRVARDALDLKIGGVRDRHFWI